MNQTTPPANPASEPRRDCAQIARQIGTVTFPWDTTRSLELALFRTFASPRIGGLLHGSGEFEARTQKRYDDTDLIVSEIVEHGFDSERGGRAIARMNALHARFRIANDDFLYVLSTFVFEPIRWNARFGWRRMSETERLGWFWFWRGVGERMRIQNLPDDFERFERFSRNYEAANFRFTEANRHVALATREMFAGWFPRLLRPLVRRSIHGLLDAPLLVAFGLRPAPPWLVWTTRVAMRARALALRGLPKRRRPVLRTRIPRSDYPQGYRIESLGPPPFDAGP
ncbi:MAG TPA: oxygenase MpaB family protein [Caldimonas sp.]